MLNSGSIKIWLNNFDYFYHLSIMRFYSLLLACDQHTVVSKLCCPLESSHCMITLLIPNLNYLSYWYVKACSIDCAALLGAVWSWATSPTPVPPWRKHGVASREHWGRNWHLPPLQGPVVSARLPTQTVRNTWSFTHAPLGANSTSVDMYAHNPALWGGGLIHTCAFHTHVDILS